MYILMGDNKMDNKTQLNESLNATILNTQTSGNHTILNGCIADRKSNRIGEILGGKYTL